MKWRTNLINLGFEVEEERIKNLKKKLDEKGISYETSRLNKVDVLQFNLKKNVLVRVFPNGKGIVIIKPKKDILKEVEEAKKGLEELLSS
jgi:hypothetical protein